MHPPHTQGPAGVPCQGHPNHLSLRNRRSRFRFSPMWRPARLFAIGAVFCLIALFAPAGATAVGVAPAGEAPGLDVGLLGGVALFGEAKVPLSAPSRAAGIAATSGGSACPLPLTHDTYDGFHIGVPSGWYLSTLQGAIAVSASPSGTLGSLLYPALLTKGLTATSFFSSYMRYQQRLVSQEGGSLSFQLGQPRGGLPTASISLSSGQTHLRGGATVMVLPLRTQLASQEAVFFAYWAPTASLSANAGLLTAIGRCYGPERADLFQVFQDQVFTYIMPPRWTVLDEGQDDIDLRGPQASRVSYVLYGILPGNGVSSPQTAITYIFGKLGITVTGVLSTEVFSNRDAYQAEEYLEFTAQWAGVAVHGLVFVGTDTSTSGTYGAMRLATAPTALWSSLNGGMIQMMGAIQHNFTQDLQSLQALNHQWQDFSGQVANFDDTLNSQQLVQDPSTGGYYEAPYSSYIVDGPDGPGYYLPNGQRLNPVERP